MKGGNLLVTINESGGKHVDHLEIENGDLYAYYKGGLIMSKVNLGRVVGAPGINGTTGDKGAKGDTGAPGINGTNGTNGISPTFSIDENGDLLADYDNPYNPNA